jgi:tripartite-type tricarboxylate transporter receptor subunit TctC
MNRRSAIAAAGAIAFACPWLATAQPAYPSQAIKIIIPSTPGGLSDPVVRFLGDHLQKAWGQPVVMDHRAGAGGIVGLQQLIRAAPDGHTLALCSSGPLIMTPAMNASTPYVVTRDLAPVGSLLTFDNVLVTPLGFAPNTVAEIIALAKEKPGSVNFASAGIGASHHLSGELFKKLAGVNITHVPYKGTAPAQTDVVAGQVQLMFANLPAALPLIKAGRLKAIAVTGPRRSPELPAVPTMQEAGVPGFVVVTAVALYTSAGVPQDIIQRINAEVNRAWQTPEGKKLLATQHLTFTPGTPADLAGWYAEENAKWTAVIKSAGIKAVD